MADMLTQILPIKEMELNFKEVTSIVDPNCVVEALSVSLQTCEPFSIDSSTSLAPDIPRTDVLVCPFNSIMTSDYSGQRDNVADSSKNLTPDIPRTDALDFPFNCIMVSESSERRDTVTKDDARFNDDGSETKFPEIRQSSTRRSTRKSKLKLKTETKTAARKCMSAAEKKSLLDLKVARRQRSRMCKQARSSAWGLLGSLKEVFELNAGSNINQNENKESRKGSVRRGRKRDKTQTSQSLQNSKGETSSLTRGFRLKLKLGKELSQSCLLNGVTFTDKYPEKYGEVRIESTRLTNGIDGKLDEEVPRSSKSQCFDENLDKAIVQSETSVLDVLAAKDVHEESACKGSDNINTISLEHVIEELGETVENGCLDSGTSPDSEVINLTPEAHISGIVLEDLQIASKTEFTQGDVTSLILPQASCKKGKKKNRFHAGNCNSEGGSSSPEIIINDVLLEKNEQNNSMGDDSCSIGASISTTTGVASCNASSSEGCPMGLLLSSQGNEIGVSTETLIADGDAEVDRSLHVGLESPESRFSDMLLPDAIPKGQKLPKSSRSRGMNKSRSEVTELVNKKKVTCRQKGSQAKSISKCTNKGKKGDEQAICKVQSYPDTGNYERDDLEKLKEECRSTTGDSSNLAMVANGVGDPHRESRNAWVCCDNCCKWRRIEAVLADSIEATDCRWICKDNMDKNFADCLIPQEKSNAEINAELEISDASCEEDACDARLNSNLLEQKRPAVPLQSPWKLIKSNLFLHRNRKNQTIDEIMVCHCKPPLDGRRGCRDGCLNRMLNIECVKGTCPCGELCSNQQFQKRKYAKLKCFKCGKKGYGLQLQEDIPKGRFLIEYVGEVLDMHTYEARQREYASKGHKHFYFMTLNGSEVIDACAKGNLGRFINHSCEPNCRTEKWMVNGEVCIGLFAIRDIKKGEELTFDYNYVRVFGAAAKKCVCGSSRCRGYIGGDPLNAEAIVQGDSDDEYPEPLMLYEDGTDKLDDPIPGTSSFDGAEMQSAENLLKNNGRMDKAENVVGQLEIGEFKQTLGIFLQDKDEIDDSTVAGGYPEINPENEDSNKRSSSSATELESNLETEGSLGLLPSSVLSRETLLQPHDGKSRIISKNPQEYSVVEEDVKHSLFNLEGTETSSVSSSVGNLLPNTADTQIKSKLVTDESCRIALKSQPRTKTSRSSSIKRGKLKSNACENTKPPEIKKSLVTPSSSKKLLENTLDSRFEAVQETLNNLLDADGGISKRRDASRGYLKLLYLTAASGDSVNGEGIQSNRDLSMILDALLKTKSRTVLVDIINKNGLQMLHNIMKRYRKEFNKIPILRKLLKVLEYLAVKEIITLDIINRGPTCPGVESFRESILQLTEHIDKQVHQIARNFRDKWIRRHVRKLNCIERDVDRKEPHKGSNFNRFSVSQNHSPDHDGRPVEVIDERVKQSFNRNALPADAGIVEGSSASCGSSCITDGKKSRKRKSRWDQPAETNLDIRSPSNKEARYVLPKSYSSLRVIGEAVSETGGSPGAKAFCQGTETNIIHDERQTDDEDVPPGFSSPLDRALIQSNASSTATGVHAGQGAMGHPQTRFISRLSISYGVPLSILQQHGTPQTEIAESWVVAPSMPFHPFPPLPIYPRDRRDLPPALNVWSNRAPCQSDQNQNTPITSAASPLDGAIPGSNNRHNFQRAGGSSNTLGRKYFRQQKWNNSKFGPPWNPRKNECGEFLGADNSINGMGSIGSGTGANGPKSLYSSEVSSGNRNCGNSFHH